MTFKSFLTAVFLLVIFISLLSTVAVAQVDRAALTGHVQDSTGATIPGAAIRLTPIAGGAEREATATDAGTYQVTGLVAGEWLVEIGAGGFQTVAQTVSLELGQRSRLDMTLPVGAISERVIVEGVTPLLDTQSAVLGTVVSKNEIATSAAGDCATGTTCFHCVPGVQGDRYTEQAGGTSAGRTGGVSVHGNRSLQNNFLLDGVDNNSFSTNVQELSTQLSRPSIDAIGEFKVVTSPFAAEYGRAPGAAIIVTTKSGSERAPERARRTTTSATSMDSTPINFFAKPPTAEGRPTSRTSSAATSAARCERATGRSSSPTTRARGSSRACCAPAPS